ncbi:MAG: FAD-binding protein [Prevotella sp.]|nr:FAD-binding protein [Prevotella sp.]
MIREIELRVPPEQAANNDTLAAVAAKETAIDRRTICCLRVLKRSIDARQRNIFVNLKLRLFINEQPADEGFPRTVYPDVSACPRVIIVGAGPAGLFAALRAIEIGLRPVIIERGKDVRRRKKDTAQITKGIVNGESNYCFGEGGAGAYSDGKLFTRSKKRGQIDKILFALCQHGADTSILSDAHPHIGTDRLPRIIENIRATIINCGGEVHFETKMLRLIVNGNLCLGCEAINMAMGREETYRGPVILATGHSARDVYRYLFAGGIALESKALAMGVRLEHPAELIDRLQYHNRNGRGKYLPAAEYNFVTQTGGRGVYSFCMCPGGFVIPSATAAKQVVVNGMSPAARNSRWSNSGMVVEFRPDDLSAIENGRALFDGDAGSPLAMMEFQEQLERLAWQQGGMRQTAPAQRMDDFVNGRLSYDLPRSSYAPGLVSSPLHFWLPKIIAGSLQQAFTTFGKNSRGFLTNEAVVIAAETRTSSPVRIPRDQLTLSHIELQGLFPCGEGAGYSGGIVSSAVDGVRCAEAVKASIGV